MLTVPGASCGLISMDIFEDRLLRLVILSRKSSGKEFKSCMAIGVYKFRVYNNW